MPVVAILAAALVLSLVVAFAVTVGAVLLACAVVGAIGYGVYYLIKTHNEEARRQEAQRAIEERERNEIMLLTDQSKQEFPTDAIFCSQLADALERVLRRSGMLLPSKDILAELFRTARSIYIKELPPPVPTNADKVALSIAAQQTQNFDPAILAEAMLRGFAGFLQKLPTFDRTQFTLPIAELVDLPTAIYDLITPFRDPRLFETNHCRYIWEQFERNAVKMGGGNAPVYPQELQSDWPKYKIANLYLKDTPFNQLFQMQIPFGFEDETRCTHHWCLGHNGTGKTTYLRHFIKADLDRVERGECSLIIIDSKKLIREMRMLKQFATTLRDHIIIVDPAHPVALNPFHLPKEQSVDVLTYMLGNLTEASDLQKGALSYLIRAARTYDKPNLYVLRDFFSLNKKRGHVELPDGFERFDNNTQFWFRNTFPGLHNATKEGVQQRLMNILDHPMLEQMLNADRCALDLFEVLHEGGKVLLVDTDRATLTPERTEVLGRLFIALIDQLSSRRTHLDERKLKPIFVYLDEAHDYIKSDERFADILEKARAQRIAVTVAHHHEGQIDPRIEASLKNAGLKSRCDDIKSVSVKTRRRNYSIPVTRLDFDKLPQMTQQQYGDMRQRIVDIYGIRAISSPTPLPDDISEPITKNY